MIGSKKILCVITARAGSKGIPGKNLRLLLGKPLFMWSVEAALESKYIDRVSISSNCSKVEKIFDDFIEPTIKKMVGMSISHRDERKLLNKLLFFVKRPDNISGDLSKNEDALIHAVEFYKEKHREEYDVVINLQPTSPCRSSNLLDRCIEEYHSGKYDSLLTGSKMTPFMWRKRDKKWEYGCTKWGWQNTDHLEHFPDGDHFMSVKEDCCKRKMRQEFEESEFWLHDSGSVYIVDSKILLDTECRIGYNPCVFETKEMNNIQIDTEFDFELIENMAKVRKMESLI